MKLLIDSFKATGSMHHAYVIAGDKAILRQELYDFIEQHLKLPIRGNPDIWHSEHETLTIEEARKLRDIQAQKAISQQKKIFIIELQAITVEAQNSLLKVFEEPTPYTHFFIIAPTAEIFLPTVRSRVMVIGSSPSTLDSDESNQFIQATIPERLKMVEEIVESKDKSRAIKLIDGIMQNMHGKKPNPYLMQELLKCRMYMHDRSPSLKLLLEHISLIL